LRRGLDMQRPRTESPNERAVPYGRA
jgi:hypothetical protein